MAVDLWIAQSQNYIDIALEMGFRKFTWGVGPLIKSRLEMFSWVRAHSAAYGPVTMMLIDHAGAAEYSSYGRYEKPLAVYPTWAPDENWEDLLDLIENPVGERPDVCSDGRVPSNMRPVFGQKHRVVIHYLMDAGPARHQFLLEMRDLQLQYPEVELFISGAQKFSDLFGLGFKAVDYRPHELTPSGQSTDRVVLPTGRVVAYHNKFDLRYKDWFDLIGEDQTYFIDKKARIRACLTSVKWASMHFDSVTPFVAAGGRGIMGSKNTVFMPSEFFKVSDKDFILPAARRKAMRNLGLKVDEYDQFSCDTCILHNACTLYRQGSVCTVKGSEGMALADAFGSRNADVIMNGLSQLLQRNAERLEDSMAKEEADGELDPEVTKLSKTVFDQGVKLVKLIDPSKAGGAKVQVNVGVGQGGQANVGISGSSPKELMATVVAELEAAGIPRDEIDSTMVKGVLRNMAQVGQPQAVSTAVTKHKMLKPKMIEGTAT